MNHRGKGTGEMIRRYLAGESPDDLSPVFGLSRGALKERLRRSGVLRSQSDAATLAALRGKKDKALAALIEVNRTINRANPAKWPWRHDPTKHPRWKTDRSQIKRKRGYHEEKEFMAEALARVDYTCAITGVRGGQLSVHHVEPVWSCPERRFDRSNVIVVQRTIHKGFHQLYGSKAGSTEWTCYIEEGIYLAFC